jgi:hypothetical protein
MWDENDKRGFDDLSDQGHGQIKYDDGLGAWIEKLCLDDKNTTFLEIGTWNGLGSTKVFVDSLTKRGSPFTFWSLECNKEKSEFARNLYTGVPGVHILNETICNGSQPADFYDIFPECQDNEMFTYWNKVDTTNMNECPLFLERPELPDIFDVILLDGGEFTTYYEFQKLRNRCRYLLLDDTNTSKCKRIVQEISEWTNLDRGYVRNGFSVSSNPAATFQESQ